MDRFVNVPPEVILGQDGKQIFARQGDGYPFRQYLPCSEGCGYVIGCGDATETVAHESCLAKKGGETRVTSATGGQKGQKLARFDLVPGEPLWALAELYGRGASKYQERNWEKAYAFSLSFAALMRHAWQFWGGEDIDSETGASHLTSVAWHAFALYEFMKTHPEYDDRPKNGTNS